MDVLDGLAWHVEGAVGLIIVEPAEVEMCSCAAACLELHQTCGIGRDFEHHVACVTSDDAIGTCVQAVHEHVVLGNCVSVGEACLDAASLRAGRTQVLQARPQHMKVPLMKVPLMAWIWVSPCSSRGWALDSGAGHCGWGEQHAGSIH
jgi:hypothetical protein